MTKPDQVIAKPVQDTDKACDPTDKPCDPVTAKPARPMQVTDKFVSLSETSNRQGLSHGELQ